MIIIFRKTSDTVTGIKYYFVEVVTAAKYLHLHF